MEISMTHQPKLPDDVIFWIHGPGETLIPTLLEELKTQLDRGEILPDLPVYSSSQGLWLPLKALLIDVATPVVRTNVQTNLFADHRSNVHRGAKAESARPPVRLLPQSVHPLRTSDFATRLIAMAVGVFVFGSLASELLKPDSRVFEIVIRIVPAVLMLIVCGLCLTGPIYFARRGKDGKPRKWHVANKAAAMILGLASISCVGRGIWHTEGNPPVPRENTPEPLSVPPSTVRQLAEQWQQSMMKHDYAKVADLTWRGAIDEAGGREAFIEIVRELLKMVEDKGIKFEATEAREPANVISDGTYTFAAVPTRTWFRTAKGRWVGESFALGISTDGGKTWTFIDGASLSTAEERNAFVPKIPAALVLPPFRKATPVAD